MIPDMLTINRTTHETSEDSTSGKKTISNMGLDIINQDLEGYKDAALGTIVFNKTKISKTKEEYRSVVEITHGSLYKSKLGEFSIFKYIRDDFKVLSSICLINTVRLIPILTYFMTFYAIWYMS